MNDDQIHKLIKIIETKWQPDRDITHSLIRWDQFLNDHNIILDKIYEPNEEEMRLLLNEQEHIFKTFGITINDPANNYRSSNGWILTVPWETAEKILILGV